MALFTRVPPDAIASPQGTYKKFEGPRLIYRDLEKKWEIEGATEEENEIFRARNNPDILDLKNKDKWLPCPAADWQDVYREYVDGRLIGDMPRYCFWSDGADSGLDSIKRDMYSSMTDFLSGKTSPEDAEQAFQDIVLQVKDLLTERCLTSGNNPTDNAKMIRDTLYEFRRNAVVLAEKLCYEEGAALYGESAMTKGSYYNSNFQILSEQLVQISENAAAKLIETMPADELDFGVWENDRNMQLVMSKSFAEEWEKSSAVRNSYVDILNSKDMPPKDFSFFFLGDMGNEKNSSVIFKKGDFTTKIRISFDSRYGKDSVSLSGLFQFNPAKDEEEEKINEFLKNFKLYSPHYSSRGDHLNIST